MNLKSFLKKHFWLIVVVLAVVAHFAVSLKLALYWYNNFNLGKYDLGNVVQVVDNVLRGDFFTYTNRYGTRISRLSNHADFILLALVPFFAVFRTPVTLVVAQCLALSISALIVFLLARELKISKFSAFLFGLAYLLNADVGYLALDAFHGVTFAIPFVLLSFLFLERISKRASEKRSPHSPTSEVKSAETSEVFPAATGNPAGFLTSPLLLGFILSTFLVLISKENAALLVALLGLYAVFVKRLRELGWATFAVGLFWFVGYFFVVAPAYGPQRVESVVSFTEHLPGVETTEAVKSVRQNYFLSRYEDLGDSLMDIIISPVREPQIFLNRFSNWSYIKRLFQPLAFLPFLAPFALLLGISEYLINTLSQGSFMTDSHYGVLHYVSLLIPVVFYAALLAYRWLCEFFDRICTKRLCVVLSLGVLVCSFLTAVWRENPVLVNPFRFAYERSPRSIQVAMLKNREISEILDLVSEPEKDQVVTGGQAVPPSSDKDFDPFPKPSEDSSSKASRTGKNLKQLTIFVQNPRHSGAANRVYDLFEDREGALSAPNFLGAKLGVREDFTLFPVGWDSSKFVVADVTGPSKAFQVLGSGVRGDLTGGLSSFVRNSIRSAFYHPDYGVVYSGGGLVAFERGVEKFVFESMPVKDAAPYEPQSRGIQVKDFEFPEAVKAGETIDFEFEWEVPEDSSGKYTDSVPFIVLLRESSQSADFYDVIWELFLSAEKMEGSQRTRQLLEIPADISTGKYRFCLGWHELTSYEMSGKVKLEDAVELRRIRIE